MNLHGQIMNLPCDVSDQMLGYETAFRRGHRDARHAAAELVLAADAEIERLRAIAKDAEAAAVDFQREVLAVRRYCRDVQESGTANERAVAQTVARMLARPPVA